MGVKNAQFETARIVMIYGDNGAGKTSTSTAIRCLMTGNAIPTEIKGVTQKTALQLVNDSAREGSATVESETGSGCISWPSCKYKQKGSTATASEIALGKNPLEISDKKEKALLFAEILKSDPTKEQLKDAIGELVKDKFDNIWDAVQVNGWDKASSLYSDKSKEQQGAFRAHAGTAWGSSKAESWLPEHWSIELESASKDQLEAKKVQAQEDVEACIATEAISSEHLEELKSLVEQAPDVHNKIKKTNEEINMLNAKRKALGRRPMQVEAGNMGTPCPECGTHLIFDDGTLKTAPVSKHTQADVDARNLEIKKYDDDAHAIDVQIQKQENAKAEYQRMLKNSADAEVELSEMTAKQKKSISKDESDLNSARERLRIASLDLDAFVKKEAAMRAHKAVLYYKELSAALGPAGVRKTALEDSLEALNNMIQKNFPEYPVSINDDLDCFWDGRPLSLCCESEKWRAAIALRATIADMQNDEIILIDRADILSNKNKNILLKRLLKLKPCSIIFSTVKGKSEAVALPEKIGKAYFIESGEMETL